MEAERFEGYLADEGLEEISRFRAAAGESDEPGREAFSRCAKALIRVANGDAGYDRVVGLDLEIVPERDPFTVPPGEPLPVRVLWHGAPLAGAQVRVFLDGSPETTYERRTDAEGRVALPLEANGIRLLSVVHMEPAPEGSEADWLSTWSSLTFETPLPSESN